MGNRYSVLTCDDIKTKEDVVCYVKNLISPEDTSDIIIDKISENIKKSGISEKSIILIKNILKLHIDDGNEYSHALLLLYYAVIETEANSRPGTIIYDFGTSLPSTNIKQDSWITTTLSKFVPNAYVVQLPYFSYISEVVKRRIMSIVPGFSSE